MDKLDADLWVVEAPQRFRGIRVGTRMTVLRLPNDELLLHSPIPMTESIVHELRALGRVAHLVAPSRLHHLYVGEWKGRFPAAVLYGAPGLRAKRTDLPIDRVLDAEGERMPPWHDAVDYVAIAGVPEMNEVVLFHRATETLIVSDLVFNIGPEAPLITRLVFRLGGAYGTVGPTRFERGMIDDRGALRESLQRVLDWPFRRVVLAHGRVAEAGGREGIARGYAWVLREQ